jgi:hypothetical protein
MMTDIFDAQQIPRLDLRRRRITDAKPAVPVLAHLPVLERYKRFEMRSPLCEQEAPMAVTDEQLVSTSPGSPGQRSRFFYEGAERSE